MSDFRINNLSENFPGVKSRNEYLQAVRDGNEPGDLSGVMNSFQGDHKASDTFAFVNRLQWEDWKARLKPQAEALMNMSSYGDPSIVNQRVSEGMLAAKEGYATTQKMADQTMERFGVSRSAGELDAQKKKDSLGTARAVVDSSNRTRQTVRDTDRAIAFGGMSAPRSVA